MVRGGMTSRGVIAGEEGQDRGGGVMIGMEGETMARRGCVVYFGVGSVGGRLAKALVVVAAAVGRWPLLVLLVLAVLGRLRWMLGTGGMRGSAMNGGRDILLTAVTGAGDMGAVVPVVVWKVCSFSIMETRVSTSAAASVSPVSNM